MGSMKKSRYRPPEDCLQWFCCNASCCGHCEEKQIAVATDLDKLALRCTVNCETIHLVKRCTARPWGVTDLEETEELEFCYGCVFFVKS
ncbi:hypothetical protein LOK49_LG04G01766 [Camellia lanceoleosa]|uniref:Uncharacterized protein n=1 Tax=Camellia lanceoleosa TaxID=1840588 RepID=A0ACC0I1J0_9ERIC|nr:hypothetical protein LOK49_LG04G01766 [Camellia lanceoleosa]